MKYIFTLILPLLLVAPASGDTLRVATYNVLNYNGSSRSGHLETVIQSMNPDILVVQEMLSQTAVDSFSIAVLNGSYNTIPFHDGFDTDNHLFYRGDKFVFLEDAYLSTALRDIAEYKMRIVENQEIAYFYTAHLKASQGGANEQERLAEATILRDHLNDHPAGTNFVALGDFNFYDSDELGYQKLIGDEADNDGKLYDPIDSPGDWHDNEDFSEIHVQSTRTEQLSDGGATGGLDDRFDFLLISESFFDNVIQSSYTAYGNDGQHFNQAVNAGYNGAVSPEVADALYYASDHLPVYCDFVFIETSSGEPTEASLPQGFSLSQNCPNPFNPETEITYALPEERHVRLEIFNLLGRRVATLVDERQEAGYKSVRWDSRSEGGERATSGIYFCRIWAGDFAATRKMVLMK